jgi:hypothetical protein
MTCLHDAQPMAVLRPQRVNHHVADRVDAQPDAKPGCLNVFAAT